MEECDCGKCDECRVRLWKESLIVDGVMEPVDAEWIARGMLDVPNDD